MAAAQAFAVAGGPTILAIFELAVFGSAAPALRVILAPWFRTRPNGCVSLRCERLRSAAVGYVSVPRAAKRGLQAETFASEAVHHYQRRAS